jgi:hypothetical protein
VQLARDAVRARISPRRVLAGVVAGRAPGRRPLKRVLPPPAHTGPFSHRALLTLEAKHIPYTLETLDLDNKPQWYQQPPRVHSTA